MTIKDTIIKDIICNGLMKTRDDGAKKTIFSISQFAVKSNQLEPFENGNDKKNDIIVKSNDQILFSDTLKRNNTVKKIISIEEDVNKFNDSLIIDEEKRSRNFKLNEYFPKKENSRDIEKLMKRFEINTMKRVHSSVEFGQNRAKTYDKDLIFIKPFNNPEVRTPLPKQINEKTKINDEAFNAVLNRYLINQNANQSSINLKGSVRNEPTNIKTLDYPDLITNNDLYKVASLKYYGKGKESIKYKQKHISPEVQMKYFKFTRKYKKN